MAYIYQISFDIHEDQMSLLEIGAALERALGYLRTLLPSDTGFINARAMRSLKQGEYVRIQFESEWDYWRDLESHRRTSYLDERKLLTHFQPHVDLENLDVHVYEEIP